MFNLVFNDIFFGNMTYFTIANDKSNDIIFIIVIYIYCSIYILYVFIFIFDAHHVAHML